MMAEQLKYEPIELLEQIIGILEYMRDGFNSDDRVYRHNLAIENEIIILKAKYEKGIIKMIYKNIQEKGIWQENAQDVEKGF